MDDKGERGVKNLKKWVTSFMDGPNTGKKMCNDQKSAPLFNVLVRIGGGGGRFSRNKGKEAGLS